MPRIGVLIANTGSPAAPEPEAVRAYLSEFLADERIMPMNPVLWKALLRLCILPARSRASAQKYASIWTKEGSPLTVTMASLARKVDEALKAEGLDVLVRPAASYGEPSMRAVLEELREAGCEELVCIPLYPQTAFSTTSVVADGLQRALGRLAWDVPHQVVCGYAGEPLYVQAIVESIQAAGFDAAAGDRLLFAFHSIPLADVRAGDVYADQAEGTVRATANQLGLSGDSYALGYQCRFDRGRAWLGPSIRDAMGELIQDGGRLFVVAPNFSADCLETIHDIGQILKGAYLEAGGSDRSFVYVPCLNDGGDHVRLISLLVLRSIADAV